MPLKLSAVQSTTYISNKNTVRLHPKNRTDKFPPVLISADLFPVVSVFTDTRYKNKIEDRGRANELIHPRFQDSFLHIGKMSESWEKFELLSEKRLSK